MSTFKSPLRSGDKETNSIGEAQLAQNTAVAFSDTTKTLGYVPADTDVIYVHVDVLTAFNAATTNTITVTAVGVGALTGAADVSSTGRATVALQVDNFDLGDQPREITVTYAQTGAAASAGAANVIIGYMVNRVLPT